MNKFSLDTLDPMDTIFRTNAEIHSPPPYFPPKSLMKDFQKSQGARSSSAYSLLAQ